MSIAAQEARYGLRPDIIKFEPVDSFVIERGTIYTGPNPLDGESEDTNIRNCRGWLVRIHDDVYEIAGVELFMHSGPPVLGEPIGILVGEVVAHVVRARP